MKVIASIMTVLFTGCSVVGDYEPREDWSDHIFSAESQTSAPENPPSLKVLSWNIKFGGGRIDFWFDGYGDRVLMTEDEVVENMDGIVALINEFDPDILLTQEVDMRSKRSAYHDMVADILKQTNLNYGAWVPFWEAEYIAEQGLGPMYAGQATFSKYPITANTRIDLGGVSEQSALTQTFYLDRAIQRVTVDLGDTNLEVLNNHPEAYSTDGTKVRQIEQIIEEAFSISDEVIVGGDFNAVPPNTHRLTDFADEIEIDVKGVTAVDYIGEEELLRPLYDSYFAAVELDEYSVKKEDDQERFYTHSIDKDTFWTRKLDYLFSNGTWSSGGTIQSASDTPNGTLDPMALSDHCPIWGVLERQ